MEIKKARLFFNWSSGKDSLYALYELLQQDRFEISSLLIIIGAETRRIGMHGLRESLLRSQTAAIVLPLEILYLSSSASHEAYNEVMNGTIVKMKNDDILNTAFGDIFLEDL